MPKITSYITICLICVSAVIMVPGSGLPASNGSDASGVAMAGAYMGLARGIDAAVWNPANLGLSTNSNMSINLIHIGAGVNNNSWTLGQYNQYNGDSLATDDINDILNSVPGDGVKFYGMAESQLAGFAKGRFAFSIEGMVASGFQFSKNFLEVMFRGNELDQVYQFDDSDGEAYTLMSYNVSGALPIRLASFQSAAIGATIKYLHGFRYLKMTNTTGVMTTTMDGLEAHGQVDFKSAGSGNGFGLDLGVASEIDDNWTVSLALKNIYSQLTWRENASIKTYSFLMDPITLEVLQNTDIDSLFKTGETEQPVASISSSLPAILYLGTLYHHKSYDFTVGYTQVLTKVAAYAMTPQLAGGLQYQALPWLQLRTGIAIGGTERFNAALGFGLTFLPFKFDFGVANYGGLFPKNQRGLNIALGFGIRL